MVSELFWNLYSEKPTAIIAWKNPNPLLPAMLEASKINPIMPTAENQFIETQQKLDKRGTSASPCLILVKWKKPYPMVTCDKDIFQRKRQAESFHAAGNKWNVYVLVNCKGNLGNHQTNLFQGTGCSPNLQDQPKLQASNKVTYPLPSILMQWEVFGSN